MKVFKKNKILIATGGTGGHVFPAYSLAKNLIKNNELNGFESKLKFFHTTNFEIFKKLKDL